MNLRYLLLLGIMALGIFSQSLWAQTTHVIINVGLTFSPGNITIQQGDIIDWQIASNHNVVEVTQATWNANGTTPLAGGFSTPFGGGQVTFPVAGTFYYVCQPHAGASMKGRVTVEPAVSNPTGEVFVANLTGAQEVAPTLSLGEGLLQAELRNDSLFVSGSVSNLSAPIDVNIGGGAHIHAGLAGENGGVVFPLTFTSIQGGVAASFDAADNAFELTPTQVETLRDRGYYVNIHTTAFSPGEVRGQIQPVEDAQAAEDFLFSAGLYGSNEVPSIMTDGFGKVVLDLVGDTLTLSGTFSNLSSPIDLNIAGGAHLHSGLAGENGGIAFLLTPEVDAGGLSGRFLADSNRFILDAAQKEVLSDRGYYLNLHSTGFASGELRGQIIGQPQASFRAFLAGAQEVPSVISGGQGEAVIELFSDEVVVSGTFKDLGSAYNANIGSHLHEAIAGTNGPVAAALSPTLAADNLSGAFEADNNTLSLTTAQIEALFNRALYVNIHTEGNASGELRGQVVPEGNYFLYSLLSATQEVSPEVSPAFGAGILEVRGDQGVFSGSFDQLENGFNEAIAGGAHIHVGYAGQNGSIAFFLNTDLGPAETSGVFNPDSNVFTLSEGIRDTIRQRLLYVNIHSDSIVSGELRGQILGEAQNYFFAPLSGASEQNPVNTAGAGTLAGEWLNGDFIASGSFSGIGTFATNIAGGAHIHRGLAGQNGGIEFLLNSEEIIGAGGAVFLADSNRWTLSAGQTDTLISRGYYVNIHSEEFPSGELRGQFLPPANGYFTTTLAGKNETDPNNSAGIGALKLELVRDQLTASGSLEGLQGDFDVNVAGGAHLHRGQVGTNGGIEFLLTSEVAIDLKSATFQANSNAFTLSADQIGLLLDEGMYANIHSTDFPAGELRGQILPETNSFPEEAPAITAPASGASLTIEGDSSSAFTATWSGTTDPDGNPLAYLWELSAAQDFSSQILYLNVGASLEFTTDFATIDSILAANGLNVGDSIKLYHRATVIDGAVCQVGMADSVTLTRGTFTTSIGTPITAEVNIYPSPATDFLQIEVAGITGQQLQLELRDMRGRLMTSRSLPLTSGVGEVSLETTQYPVGVYTLSLRTELYQSSHLVIKK